MNKECPVIFISVSTGTDIVDKVKTICPQAKVLRADDLSHRPELIGEIEIVYGRLDPALFPKAKSLQWVHSTSAGVEWAQRPEVVSHPAVITNSRIHAAHVSEHAFGLLLMLVRRLSQMVLNQREHLWKGPAEEPVSLAGRTLCILGLGVIGRQCARLGKAFGMRVIGVRRRVTAASHDVDEMLPPEKLDEALAKSDVVINLLPGSSHLAGIIGRRQFEVMRPGCLFINVGRGVTVDTAAMVEALRAGRLGGAGLDVTDPEPLPKDHPLWDMPNVVITPHYAGNVHNYFELTDQVFLKNLRHFLAGQPLESVIDKQMGY